MAMPDKYPSPEGQGASADPQELLDTLEVLTVVHSLHYEALERTKKDMTAGVEAGDAGRIMEAHFFILEKADPSGDESLPFPYDQMLLTPRANEQLTIPRIPILPDIESVTIKVPRLLHSAAEYFPLPEGAEHWNDFVAEVAYDNQQQGRYLVNSRGVVPFPDSEALEEAAGHGPGPADLLQVPELHFDWTVPTLSASQLLEWIKASTMERQRLPQ